MSIEGTLVEYQGRIVMDMIEKSLKQREQLAGYLYTKLEEEKEKKKDE